MTCTLCPLHKVSDANLVRGAGPQPAAILFVAEGLGEEEERQKIPLVGPAGQLFDQLLFKAGIDRSQVRISNTCLCRPKDLSKTWTDRRGHVHYGNRQPTLEEIYTCAPTYLEEEIKRTNPNVIVPVGAIALKYLLGEFSVEGYDKQENGTFKPRLVSNGKKAAKITSERGIERWSEKYNTKLIPIIHPSALLRGSRQLNTTIEDLKRIKKASETREIVKDSQGNYVIVDSWDVMERVLNKLRTASEVSIDLETSGLDYQRDEITHIGLSWEEGTGVSIVMIDEKGNHIWSPEQKAHLFDCIDKLYADPSKCKIGHNFLKFDQHFLQNFGVRFPVNTFDTMLAHYMIDSDSGHGLKDLTWVYFSGLGGYEKEYDDAVALAKKEKRKFWTIPREITSKYNAQDCDITLRLKHKLEEKLKIYPLTEKFFLEWMSHIAECALDTERTGITFDLEMAKDMYDRMSRHVKQICKDFCSLIGKDINLGSTKQLCKVFFEDKKFPIIKKGKTGPSIDKSVIAELKRKFPDDTALGYVIEYRGLTKKMSTYLEGGKNAVLFGKSGVPDKVKELYWDMDSAMKAGYVSDGKIHCDFILTTTTTGRLSSKNINLQNIPRVTEFDEKHSYVIRHCFLADPGCKLLAADLNQAEMWILFALSKDAALKEALETKKGFHYSTASRIFSVSVDDVTDEQKSIAKTTNFAILYGATPETLAERLSTTLDVARSYVQGFHNAYPAASWWMQEAIERIRVDKYAISPFGRIRHLSAIDSPHRPTREEAERQGPNHIIQSAASDVTQIAAVKIMRFIGENGLKSRRILTIHDDNSYNVPENELEVMKQVVKEKMEEFLPELGIQLKCDIEVSDRWKLKESEDSWNENEGDDLG